MGGRGGGASPATDGARTRGRTLCPDVEFSCWSAASLRATLAAAQSRLAALQDAVRVSEQEIAWLTGRLALTDAHLSLEKAVVSYVTEMPYLVRLHVYSGRLDPIWALTDADAERLLADLSGSEADTSALEPGLGYRGFSLSRSAVGSDEGSAGSDSDASSPAFESFASGVPEIEERLLATGRNVIDDEVADHVRERLRLGLPRLAQAS